MSCGCECIANVFSTVKHFFVSDSKPAEKKGTIAGRTAADIEAGTKDLVAQTAGKTSEAVEAAIQDIAAGKSVDLSKMSDEEKKQVAEGVKGAYVSALAMRVAFSPEATNLETAEKVAAVALDQFLNDFVDNIEKGQQPPAKFPAEVRVELKKDIQFALGRDDQPLTAKDLAAGGLKIREKLQEYEKQKDAAKPADAS